MFLIKGFLFPKDICLFISSFFMVMNWRKRVAKEGFNNLLTSIKNKTDCKMADSVFIEKMVKYHRIVFFYLARILRDNNPCMITSLALFDICMKNNIKASLIVGAQKDNSSIIGHSWIEVNGSAINENDEVLKKYTRMTEV